MTASRDEAGREYVEIELLIEAVEQGFFQGSRKTLERLKLLLPEIDSKIFVLIETILKNEGFLQKEFKELKGKKLGLARKMKLPFVK